MTQEEILNCILNPDQLKKISFEQLKQVLTDYPYSQNLHFLLVQKSMQEQHPDFERHLKTAATYMNSRSFLRRQLQQNDRPSQPVVEPEPEVEPAQGNSIINVSPETLIANLPDEDLPPVAFIPDPPANENTPNHVADIATDTPPADQPPPNETSARMDNPKDLDVSPTIIPSVISPANQVDDPEIAPVEKKIPVIHEPIIEETRIISDQIVTKPEPEEPTPSEAHTPDLPDNPDEEIPGIDLEMVDNAPEVSASISPNEEEEIIEFPEPFDFDDEMDDLLSKPLIEVVPKIFAKSVKEPEPEDEISDLLLEDFNESLPTEEENLDTMDIEEEEMTLQPKLGKWIKKYQASEDKGKDSRKKKVKKKKDEPRKKIKPQNNNKKTKKKAKKKDVDRKDRKKSKKKVPEQKLSKKKAIRKFANRSIVEDGETISVTLADLYAKQGKTEKAIVAYERLSLIIPEKKAFFASLIKKLKKK